MKLERIITLANAKVRLSFVAMERSLRATGCDLPLWVIPYDDSRFDLPGNAEWWEMRELADWLRNWEAHPTMRKYQCLTIGHFQFVDTDVIFLRNPEGPLAAHSGFVTSCGHWHNPNHTYTAESRAVFLERTTTWQKEVFNTGQWACERALFTASELTQIAEDTRFKSTCLTFRFHEQPGVNLLVHSTGVPITNLTLPPHNMQSTWAGDYFDDYRRYWRSESETPYLIHWAGGCMDSPRAINEIFYNFLSPDELLEWQDQAKKAAVAREAKRRSFRPRAGRLWRALKNF
jgi:hypothetical protein